jgi:hypothetical protein
MRWQRRWSQSAPIIRSARADSAAVRGFRPAKNSLRIAVNSARDSVGRMGAAEKRPWPMELREKVALPAQVTGPLEREPLARYAASRHGVGVRLINMRLHCGTRKRCGRRGAEEVDCRLSCGSGSSILPRCPAGLPHGARGSRHLHRWQSSSNAGYQESAPGNNF